MVSVAGQWSSPSLNQDVQCNDDATLIVILLPPCFGASLNFIAANKFYYYGGCFGLCSGFITRLLCLYILPHALVVTSLQFLMEIAIISLQVAHSHTFKDAINSQSRIMDRLISIRIDRFTVNTTIICLERRKWKAKNFIINSFYICI